MHTIGQKLSFHHTGVLVKNMQYAITSYSAVFGATAVSPVYAVVSQQVSVCFINTGNQVFLELVEPFKESTAFDAYFKRGIHYYHTAYLSSSFDESLEQLAAVDYRLLNVFNSEAFNNKRCAFLLSGLGHLVEIIEEGE